ncbi:E3 ubiquitin-protein ligase TRIM56-like [Amphiura filiformis]|uniref:E3 ubiquitin-protein ligase TRIM56-like n=1 Tax=Amphiura filiformis TaxID=82378 RepID=UPI003B21BA75
MAEGGAPLERQRRTLECSICLHRFRNPKTLPCLHSFCEDCLTNYAPLGTKTLACPLCKERIEVPNGDAYYAPLGTKTLACPLCKERIEVPNGDASTFKSNFHLKELVEEVVLTDEVTKHSTEIVCNCCDEELVAVSKCLDCDQYLCSPCLKAHRRFSALREHAIATFDEIKTGKIRPRSSIKRQLMCNRHPGNKAEIFCTTCEMPICHICATLKHKSPDHECIEASEATESRRKHASEGLVKLDAVKTRFTEAEINANKTYTDSQEHIAQLKDSIEERCKCLIDKIEADKGNCLKV